MLNLSHLGIDGRALVALVLLAAFSAGASAQDRLPPIPPEKMTDAQKKAAEQFKALRGSDVFGPFVPLFRSPELMLRAAAVGEFVRYHTVLPPRLSELAILIAARQWTQQYEWSAHYQPALKAGLSLDVVHAIAENRRPEGLTDHEGIVYDFSLELHTNHLVSDQTYARAVAAFGEQGTIEIVGLAGYYTMLAMVLNTARTPVPAGAVPPLAR
jgi:4-carboxymuconolactone decarboxylase